MTTRKTILVKRRNVGWRIFRRLRKAYPTLTDNACFSYTSTDPNEDRVRDIERHLSTLRLQPADIRSDDQMVYHIVKERIYSTKDHAESAYSLARAEKTFGTFRFDGSQFIGERDKAHRTRSHVYGAHFEGGYYTIICNDMKDEIERAGVAGARFEAVLRESETSTVAEKERWWVLGSTVALPPFYLDGSERFYNLKEFWFRREEWCQHEPFDIGWFLLGREYHREFLNLIFSRRLVHMCLSSFSGLKFRPVHVSSGGTNEKKEVQGDGS